MGQGTTDVQQESPAVSEPSLVNRRTWPSGTGVNFLLLAGVAALFFHEIFLHPSRMLWGYDTAFLHTQYRWAQWRSVHVWGTFPLWDGSMLCGRSIVGDTLTALFNPFSLPFWFTPSTPWFGFMMWTETVLSLWGMFLFARRKGCDSLGAFFAAVAFALSGKAAAHLYAGHLELMSTVLALPWLLWAFDRLLERRRWPHAALLGALLVLAGTGGSVQMLFWHIFFLGLYTAALSLPELFRGRWREALSPLLWLSLAGAFFALLGAFWWFPITRQGILLSQRVGETDYSFITMFSLTLRDLFRMIWPFLMVPTPDPHKSIFEMGIFWETQTFQGVAALALGVAAPFALRHRKGAVALGMLAALMLLIGLGKYGPVYRFLFDYVPGFDLFRVPGRFAFYWTFLVALLAGLMLTHGSRIRRKRTLLVGWGLMLGVVLALSAILSMSPFSPAGLWFGPAVLAAVTLCMAFWLFGKGPSELWRTVCLVLLMVELGWVWNAQVFTVDLDEYLPEQEAGHYLARQRETEEFRYYDPQEKLDHTYAARYGLENVMGFHAAVYRHFLDMYRPIWREDDSGLLSIYSHPMEEAVCPTILDIMNVRYVVNSGPLQLPGLVEVHRTPAAGKIPERWIYRRETALPRAWLVARAVTPPAGQTVPEALCTLDPRVECLVEAEPFAGTAVYQELAVKRRAPGDATFRFTSTDPGIAVISESWHPDWRATDNGQPVAVRRVNAGQLGVAVPAGEHTLRVYYFPWDFYAGVAVSAVTALILGAALWVHRRAALRPDTRRPEAAQPR